MGAILKVGILAAILSTMAADCGEAAEFGGATEFGGVTYARCPLDSHTEAFPRRRHYRHAYACRSNQSGFLSHDERTRMRPL
jgi:hypothetical protein